jgi:hypothetical protein
MKIFKLKHFLILMVLGLLWSCQIEEEVAAHSSAAVGIRKKRFERDGIPSDSDDQYEFSKSQYYHNDKLLRDTIQIANLLSNARLLHIDGTRKDICVTDQEAKAFSAKLNLQNNDQNRAAASSDGDNYMQYFYEIARIDTTRPTRYCDFLYFTIEGPHKHSSEQAAAENYTFKHYKRTGLTGGPSYVRDWNTSGLHADFKNLFHLLSYCQDGHTTMVPNTLLNHYEVDFTINVYNTTRFKRNVEIVADNGTVVSFSLLPKAHRSLSGKHYYDVPRKFNGINNFIVKWVRSNKA